MTLTKRASTVNRAASFLAACAVALVSGTPYLYSTYANQLTTRLTLTALQSNVIVTPMHSFFHFMLNEEVYANLTFLLFHHDERELRL